MNVEHHYEDILELQMARHCQNELLNIDGELDIHSGDTYTVQQAVNLLGFGWFHVKLSLLVGLCWMADSMEMTILSIIGPTMQCEWEISTFQKALLTTIVFLGMMISPTFWSQLSDRYGRKSALTFCGVLLVLYGLLSSVAPNFTWLIILRGLVGFSIGCVPQSVTLYAEFLPSKHKGKCVVLMDWLTESARFHTLNGNNDKAVQVLNQIAKDNNRQMLIGRLATDFETDSPLQMRTLFKPELRKKTLLLWFLWMSCAFCYYGLVLISAELFLKDKADAEPNHKCSRFDTKDFMDLMWITFSEFPGIFSTIAVIKRYGKKKTMALQFLIFSGCVSLLTVTKSRIYTTSVLFIARGVISGLFQAAYIYTPEIYPNNLRSLGVGGCSTIARIGAMATPFVSQVLLQSSSSGALFVYSLVGLSAAAVCIILPDSQILA
ncbi:synaptic vesicle 2-related protein isoform X2 [Ceratitis capitata]|uniref:synaptic vesicle 2-related protein isoform X2 n=1 Tax=Ceratitis capitata TaxID=7213 RepID=UPI00032993EF|nr:synaptic vesicle 2-related protein isoform X2 [Ceratitis capitata]